MQLSQRKVTAFIIHSKCHGWLDCSFSGRLLCYWCACCCFWDGQCTEGLDVIQSLNSTTAACQQSFDLGQHATTCCRMTEKLLADMHVLCIYKSCARMSVQWPDRAKSVKGPSLNQFMPGMTFGQPCLQCFDVSIFALQLFFQRLLSLISLFNLSLDRVYSPLPILSQSMPAE